MAKMTREEFDALVAKYEAEAAKDPDGYRKRVGLFAALGYGFILLLLVLALGVTGGIAYAIATTGRLGGMAVKLLIAAAIFSILLLRALWVTFDRPEGIRLTREEAPRLFEAVDRMTDALAAPRFHHVLLTDDFNAFVSQRPRLGVLGWQENYLCLGLPLMHALSPEQFEAVLAHELGHLRGGHGRFGGWIYRVNRTWEQLLERTEQNGGSFLSTFFKWYAPKFTAYSFALRRMDEYAADAAAAQLTSPRAAADALALVPVQARLLEEGYWGEITKSVQRQTAPPANPFSAIPAFFRSGYRSEVALPAAPTVTPDRAFQEALRAETTTTDTHPSLSDRLRALGQEPRLVEMPTETAAGHFLGASAARYAERLDREWRERVEPMWKARHDEVQKLRAELDELNRRAGRGETLTDEEAWKRADWTEDYVSPEDSLPLYRALTEHPELGLQARFAVGRILITRDDPEGVALLESVMREEHRATLPALGLLYDYHKRRGDDAAAKAIYTQGVRHADREDDAEAERATPGDRNTRYLPHELPPEKVAELRGLLTLYPDIAEAYLVRKDLKHFPERPLYVLGYTLTNGWRRVKAEQDCRTLFEAMMDAHGAEFQRITRPGDTFVIPLNLGEAKWLHKPLRNVPDSLIYEKPKA